MLHVPHNSLTTHVSFCIRDTIFTIRFLSCFNPQLKGSDQESTLNEHLEFVQDRPFNDLRYPMDSSKLRELGWQPKVDWEQGIQETGEETM